jgi:hypothetical protein
MRNESGISFFPQLIRSNYSANFQKDHGPGKAGVSVLISLTKRMLSDSNRFRDKTDCGSAGTCTDPGIKLVELPIRIGDSE